MAGFHVRFAETIDAGANAKVQALAASLLADLPSGVTDIIPGYVNLYLEYDGNMLKEERVRRWVERHRQVLRPLESARGVEIPVVYDGEDLPEVLKRLELSREDFIARLGGKPYRVYAVGFSPGYPFMGELAPELRLPRRASPRARVPAHSLAIAGAQVGIYPLPTPGGWNLIGHTLVRIYDPHRARPFLLEPGDEVSFKPGQGEVPLEPQALELLPEEPKYPVFRVLEAGLLDLVVDAGRFMAGRFGLSRGGPLDARSARLANGFVGNGSSAPLLEINLRGPRLSVLAPVVAAFAGFGLAPLLNGEALPPFTSFALAKGDVLSFKPAPPGARGYLAVAGGLESRTFMGSAAVDVKGRIGRGLREGDVLGVATLHRPRPGFSFWPYVRFTNPTVLRLVPGPQASVESLEALTAEVFTVQAADRLGIRLAGPLLPGGEVISEGVPIGALQVTPKGEAILLLHDRGTLGGYTKPALLYAADLPRAAQLGPGGRVRFRFLEAAATSQSSFR